MHRFAPRANGVEAGEPQTIREDALGAGRHRAIAAEIHQAHDVVAVLHAGSVQVAGERQAGGWSPLARAVHLPNSGAQLGSAEEACNVRQRGARLVLKARVRRGQVFQRAANLHPRRTGNDGSRIHRDAVLLHA